MANIGTLMATLGLDIRDLRQGSTEAKNIISSLSQSVGGSAVAISSLVAAEFAALRFAVGTISGYIMQAVAQINDALRKQERVVVFERFAESASLSAKMIVESMKEASGGLLTVENTIQTVNESFALGFDMSKIEDMAKMSKVFSKAMGRDFMEMYHAVSFAVAKGNERMLRSMGVIVDISTAEKKYAESLRKTAAELNETERMQAAFDAVREKSIEMTEKLGKTQETSFDSMKKTWVSILDTLDQLKDNLILPEEEYFDSFMKSLDWMLKNMKAAGEKAQGFFQKYWFQPLGRVEEFISRKIGGIPLANQPIERPDLKQRMKEMEEQKVFMKQYEDLVDKTLTEVDKKMEKDTERKKELTSQFYKEVKVKTSEWVNYQIEQLEREKEKYISGGVDKIEVERWFQSERFKIINEFNSESERKQSFERELTQQTQGEYEKRLDAVAEWKDQQVRVLESMRASQLYSEQEYWDTVVRINEAAREKQKKIESEYMSAMKENDLQERLSIINLAERERTISKTGAIRERIKANEELLSIQQEHLKSLDKLKDPSSWYAQIDAINRTRESLVDLNIQLREQIGSFEEGMKEGLERYVRDAETIFQNGVSFITGILDGAKSTMSDFLVDAMGGELKTAEDYFQSFGNTAKRVLANILAERAIIWFLQMMGIATQQNATANTSLAATSMAAAGAMMVEAAVVKTLTASYMALAAAKAMAGMSGAAGAAGGGGGAGMAGGGGGVMVHEGGPIRYEGGDAPPVRRFAGYPALKQDERRAILKVGEFVIPKYAVNEVGVDSLERLRIGKAAIVDKEKMKYIEKERWKEFHEGGRVEKEGWLEFHEGGKVENKYIDRGFSSSYVNEERKTFNHLTNRSTTIQNEFLSQYNRVRNPLEDKADFVGTDVVGNKLLVMHDGGEVPQRKRFAETSNSLLEIAAKTRHDERLILGKAGEYVVSERGVREFGAENLNYINQGMVPPDIGERVENKNFTFNVPVTIKGAESQEKKIASRLKKEIEATVQKVLKEMI